MDAEREYNNRARVPESAEIIAGWARDAAAFRESGVRAELHLAYGAGEREKLDLFLRMPRPHPPRFSSMAAIGRRWIGPLSAIARAACWAKGSRWPCHPMTSARR
jgi:hypothetical protein